jgi:Protein of unknown function (DUF3617)
MNPKFVLLAALACVPFAAGAQTQAPGLWEHSMTPKAGNPDIDAAMAQLKQRMASMTPEQRQQMESMMARNGMKVGGSGVSVQVCVTKEEAAKPPEARMHSGDCKPVDVQRSGNRMSYRFECSRGKGDGEMTFVSDKQYTGRVTFDSDASGKPQHIAMEMSGKWLASDCGDVKPRTAAPSK